MFANMILTITTTYYSYISEFFGCIKEQPKLNQKNNNMIEMAMLQNGS